MWPKKAIDWVEDGTAFVSVPFTWELPQAYSRCVFLREQAYHVRAGGPAVSLMPEYLAEVAEIGGEVNALPHHNPNATFTSRGCIRNCGFCAVPKIEPDFVELPMWEARPIVCDNNLLACSTKHFDRVVDSLKGLSGVDFNQGLDARLLTDHHAERLAELDLTLVRLSWDHTSLEGSVMSAIQILRKTGLPRSRIRVYVLIGFDDSPEDARYRLESLQRVGIDPNPMRYHPLDALELRKYVAPNWTARELHRYMRYWSRLKAFRKIPFDEFWG